jgi:predicted O-methyltransferase YrrM
MYLFKENFDDLKNKAELKNELSANNGEFFAAKQLLRLHQDAFQRENPVIVELGVDVGASTKTFLNAISFKPNAYLISVDIDDCSSVANTSKWTFIHSDSTDIEVIEKKAPIISQRGIDLLYIDSSHSAKHVKKEFELFYPFLNKDASIYFDDCEYFPYMKNQRKDNAAIEFGLRKIKTLIENISRSNLSDLELEFYYGSTGLARLTKTSQKGAQLKQIVRYKNRGYISAILALPFSYILKKTILMTLGIFKR